MIEKLARTGLVGASRCFKMAIEAHGKGGRLLFVGSPFTCLPFAEFLTYAIRELPYRAYFSTNGLTAKVADIVEEEDYEYQLAKELANGDGNFAVVVLLGD